MLRSLVGSEMCIRDSPIAVFTVLTHCVTGILQAMGLFTVPAMTGIVQNVCLLYTSDAADDLLCVDLGGRRIL